MWFQASTRFSFLSPFFFSAVCYICSFPLSKTKHPYQCVCFFFFNAFSFFRCFLASHCKNQVMVFFFSKKPQNKTLSTLVGSFTLAPQSLSFFFSKATPKKVTLKNQQTTSANRASYSFHPHCWSLLVTYVQTSFFFLCVCVSLLTTTAAKKKEKNEKKKLESFVLVTSQCFFFFFIEFLLFYLFVISTFCNLFFLFRFFFFSF